MRLAGIEKGGFYPFPPHMAEATASWFIPLPADGCGRLFDSCALDKLLNGIRFSRAEHSEMSAARFVGMLGSGIRHKRVLGCAYLPADCLVQRQSPDHEPKKG